MIHSVAESAPPRGDGDGAAVAAPLYPGNGGTVPLVADGAAGADPVVATGTLLATRLVVNGVDRALLAPAHRTLLETLREDLGLTGTKHGCELGECGACTVLVDGEPRLACLTLLAAVRGRSIITIEGLGNQAAPHPLQAAFVERGAAQCGYCTGGMLLAAAALLGENADPSDGEVRAALAGNLCRCTGYAGIVAAVRDAARAMAGDERHADPAARATSGGSAAMTDRATLATSGAEGEARTPAPAGVAP